MAMTVLIPALKPSEKLLEVIAALTADSRVRRLILVNDGSPPEFDPVFSKAAEDAKVLLLKHAVNLGKGAALRTGMNQFLYLEGAAEDVLVTADADGQHLPDDILAVGAKAMATPGELVLGSRAFAGEVPLRSRFGNSLTQWVFRLVIGRKVPDTQTGLRAIPVALMPLLLRLRTNGYDFETEMLVVAAREKVKISSVPIATVYIENNRGSHFNPLLDSMRIYFVFVRFLSSSFLTAIIDYLAFTTVLLLGGAISWGIVTGRLLAGTANFVINKELVFRSRAPFWRALLGYAALVAALGAVAYAFISLLVTRLHWNPFVAKVAVEGLLLLGSFVLQRDIVFSNKLINTSDEPPKTDWDSYYKRPYATSHYGRKITTGVLSRLIRTHVAAPGKPLRIVELGGANSCFYERLVAQFHPAQYDVVDNNELGLRAFEDKKVEQIKSEGHSVNLLTHGAGHLTGQFDLCFSVGLVEHFDPEGTRKVIESHFEFLAPGGIVIITYPTPTFLYRTTRRAAEMARAWIFWDERPLGHAEVEAAIRRRGEVLHREVNWWIFLTQGIVVARKANATAEAPALVTTDPLPA